MSITEGGSKSIIKKGNKTIWIPNSSQAYNKGSFNTVHTRRNLEYTTKENLF